MAKRIVDEELKLSIIIDGNAAQKELLNLEKSTRSLNTENKELLTQKRLLEKQGKKNSDAYRNLNRTIRQNNLQITANKNQMSQLQKEIGLTGLTTAQLDTTAKQLKATLRHLIPDSTDYVRYKKELADVNKRLAELRGGAEQAGFSLNKMATGFNKYSVMGASIVASIAGGVVSIQKVIDYNGKLSDSQADVMKTTSLTKKEVNELTASFGLFKTRTARVELLKFAEEGGRLGIQGIENVKAFVRVANQMKVALGDDLSEVQIREVGKMVDIYKVGTETGRDFEGAMLSLGSAINEVSYSGSNNAGYLVNFLKRTAGIASQTKLSATANIGYAATFDEIGQSVEVSATMMNKVWIDMFKNPEEYAKIVGDSLKDFKDLLEKDANQAMIKFLKGLNGNSEGLSVMTQKLEDLEVGGTRGIAALSAIASNTEKLEARQRTAMTAMMEATSLTNEYNIKNENLAASLAKIKETVIRWYSSEGIMDWLIAVVGWFERFIGVTDESDQKMVKFRNRLMITVKVFAILLASLMTNVTWQRLVLLWTSRNTQSTLLYNLAVKARAVAERAATVFTQAYAMVTMLLRGNIVGATQAFRAMTLAMATTPWGALLVVLSAVTTAYFLFRDSVDSATLAQKKLDEIQGEVNKSIKGQRDKIDALLKVARDENVEKQKRLDAIKALVDINSEYLNGINLENINTLKSTEVIEKYITALSKKLKLQATERALQESYEREQKIRNTDLDEYGKWYYDYPLWHIFGKRVVSKMRELRKNEELNKELEIQEKLKKSFEEQIADDPTTANPDTNGTTGGLTDAEKEALKKAREAAAKKAATAAKARAKAREQLKKESLSLKRELEDAAWSNQSDSYQKELEKLDTGFERKQEDYDNKKIKQPEIDKAIKESQNKKLLKEQREFLAEQAEQWKAQNDFYDQLKIVHEETYLLNKQALVDKYSKTEIDKFNEQAELEKAEREKAYNENLQAVGNDQKKRQALKEDFDKSELEAEQKKLEDLLLLYNKLLSGAEIGGIDFSLLTPKQEEKLKNDVEKVVQSIEKIKAAKSGEKDDSGKEKDLGLGEVDVLGFTQGQWEVFFENIEKGTIGIQTMSMAVQALLDIWSQYNQYVEANENARLQQFEKSSDSKQRRLKRQLDTGVIDHDQYGKAVESINADFDRKKAELEYKQAKRKKKIAIAETIINTSIAIMKAYSDLGPIAGTVLAVLMSVIGGLQLATISRQPLPSVGYEEGYYNDYVKRTQDGKIFKSTFGGTTKSGVVRKPTHFLTGENGPEMIIDAKAFRQMNPDLRDSLIRELRGIKGFENGYYSPESMRVEIPEKGMDNERLELVLIRIEVLLSKLEENGVEAFMSNKNMRNMKYLREGLRNFERMRENNKI
ncbi:phage tail tape measure protein [Flavobacterium sp. NKUCC04_CG]|uniref:phage tail tape measure protein n=1 Tax=Flavobacterium sp. NKUCC04_CG TaxID=2842121 RepID=UPI001C5AF476|nr:phage tail tape measure protein [Flavobacterium sp. NKUCC04_CG]MBW3519492.1 phage tail tape measure protein [Flavobacterium sp. NKUCC04_CG]